MLGELNAAQVEDLLRGEVTREASAKPGHPMQPAKRQRSRVIQ
jgi:hypothetical protein